MWELNAPGYELLTHKDISQYVYHNKVALMTVQLNVRYQGSTRFWLSDRRLKLLRNLFSFKVRYPIIMQAYRDPNPKAAFSYKLYEKMPIGQPLNLYYLRKTDSLRILIGFTGVFREILHTRAPFEETMENYISL